MRWMILAATLTLALGQTTSQAAQVYKWVDAQGVTHFDAQPPAGQTAEEIDTGKPVSASPAPPPQNQEGAREQEAQLQNNPRVRQEVNGEFRRFTEEERQGRIAEVKQYLDDQCN
jgi:secreted protein with Ig-like and vWFA domain